MKRLKRAYLWIKELTISLFKYWLKHPLTIHRIIIFFFMKAAYIPMFLHRNTATEHYSGEFKSLILKTIKLYQQNSSFDLEDKTSYKRLEKDLENPYQILYFIVKKLKPKIVVETGVAKGVSTGFILQAIKDNGYGKLYSIDLPFQWYSYGKFNIHLDSLPAGKLPGYLVPDDLKKNWKLIIGDTKERLPKLLKKLANIDMFFHDSEHTYKTMTFEYNEAWPRLTKKGVLISDDIDFSEAFNHFIKQKKRKKYIFKQVGIIFKSANRKS